MAAKYPEKILLKVPSGTCARISAVSDNRQAFIRDAIDAALGVKPKRVVPVERSDTDALLEALVSPRTERNLMDDLGWPAMRVSRAVSKAGNSIQMLGGGLMRAR